MPIDYKTVAYRLQTVFSYYIKSHGVGNITEREFLIAELLRFKKENKRIPLVRDMRIYDGYPSEKRYVKEFGSLDNAIEEVFYNKEFIISELLRFEEENGRVPEPNEMTLEDGYVAISRIREVFGSWANAKKETPFKTRIDEYFFSIEKMNLRKWYIVGYIIADGNVNANRLYIYTTEKDKENLFEMHKYMNISTNIYDRYRGNGSPVEYQIAIKNYQWISDLALYGAIPNKSKIAYIPLDYLKTPEEEAAICRGIFDGDGSISYDTYLDTFYPVFSVSGSKQLCEDYAYLLKKNCGVNCNVIRSRTIFRIKVKGKKCQKIYDFLYGHDNFYIKRKKERFEKLLNGTFTLEDDNY